MTVKMSLPPVRRPVPLRVCRTRQSLEASFAGRAVSLCGSGTQALALALAAARARSTAVAPEVILPAYGCPDLVAASVFAGVRPRLVDTAPGQWGYDLESLAAAITNNSVAIVAVNLLGTGDQAAPLREICSRHGVALIQDSAQHLPQELPAPWPGDYVILSFGRGKPLNLLRGGALLHPPEHGLAVGADWGQPMGGLREWPAMRSLAGVAFNLATHASVYGLARKLLGSSVGRTRYEPLEAIQTATAGFIAELESGLAAYRVHPGYRAQMWTSACNAWRAGGVETLVCASQEPPGGPRLRLAMLARDRQTRDGIVAALDSKGLGASSMYGESMEKLEGVPGDVAAQGPFRHAAELAQRLFTLPTHSGVTADAVQLAQATVSALLARSG